MLLYTVSQTKKAGVEVERNLRVSRKE